MALLALISARPAWLPVACSGRGPLTPLPSRLLCQMKRRLHELLASVHINSAEDIYLKRLR